MVAMRRVRLACFTLLLLLLPVSGFAIETAPRISDREIIERLTRLEEGQNSLREGQESLRKGQDALRADMQQLRQEMRQEIGGLRQEMLSQIQQLRADMNAQFAHIFQLLVGMLGAFAAIVVATIGFAFWDRKTMMRPLDNRLKVVEEEIAQNRPRLHSLVEALRGLSQQDPRVADVLKQFDLL